MTTRLVAILAVLAAMLAGCATTPQQPVQLSRDAVSQKANRIGVAMTPLPKLDVQFPGAGCLLCLATASIANGDLTRHAKTLPYEDLPALKQLVADRLKKGGVNAVVIADPLNLEALPDSAGKGPNIAGKNFAGLAGKYRIDKLLVIDIAALGFVRTYSAYIPTSDPKSLLRGTGYLVNLKTNTYEWYQPVEINRAAGQKWDEPPNFPGLTNAYFQAVEIGKDSFLKPIADAAPVIAPPAAIPVATPVATPPVVTPTAAAQAPAAAGVAPPAGAEAAATPTLVSAKP